MRGRISLLRGTRFSVSLFLFLSLSPLAVQSYRGAARCSRAALSLRLQRRARSQRTIKKSTKNKLRSAHPPLSPPSHLGHLSRPFLSRSSFSRARLSSLSSACCNLTGVCGRERVLSSILSFRPFLSHSFSAVLALPRRLRGLSPPRASLPSFSRGLFGVGHGEAAYERRGGNGGEKSERDERTVCNAVCARTRLATSRRVASRLPPFSVRKRLFVPIAWF